MNWGEGLVRQLGPWKPTAQDIFTFAAPRPHDPSDVNWIAPDGTPNVTNTRAQYVTEGGGKTVIRKGPVTTVLGRVIDDPRVAAPGRRLSESQRLGYRRMPMEPLGDVKPLQMMMDIPTVEVSKQEDLAQEEDVYLPIKLSVPPYTMPDTSQAPPLSPSQLAQFQQMVADNKLKSKGLIEEVINPWKAIYASLDAAEKDLAKKAITTFNKMTVEQQLRELNSKTSIVGNLFRRVQVARGKTQKTITDVLQTMADLVMFATFIL